MTRKIALEIILYSDCYRCFNALDMSELYYLRINHSEFFAKGKKHINGIENFWNQAKGVLRKYNVIPKETFPLFLKEFEIRFNYGSPKQQLKILKKWADI